MTWIIAVIFPPCLQRDQKKCNGDGVCRALHTQPRHHISTGVNINTSSVLAVAFHATSTHHSTTGRHVARSKEDVAICTWSRRKGPGFVFRTCRSSVGFDHDLAA